MLALWSKNEQFYALDSRVQVREIASKRRGILGNFEKIKALAKLFREEQAKLVISFIHQLLPQNIVFIQA